MRSICCAILLSAVCFSAVAQESVPPISTERFPSIRASLEDGFYSLAEYQVQEVLRGEPDASGEREVRLLLAEQYATLRTALAGSGVPVLVNDSVDVARAVRADGVHVGPGDTLVISWQRTDREDHVSIEQRSGGPDSPVQRTGRRARQLLELDSRHRPVQGDHAKHRVAPHGIAEYS